MALVIPPEVAAKLADFLAARKTGKVELDIKDGKISNYRLTESGSVKEVANGAR